MNFFKDGILLLEVNRMLRAGGYFAWAAQPVYKHEEAQQKVWKGNFSDFLSNKLSQLFLSGDAELI